MPNFSLMSRMLNKLTKATTEEVTATRVTSPSKKVAKKTRWGSLDLSKLENLSINEVYKEANFEPPISIFRIEEILETYGARTKVIDFWIGPCVTTYEVKLPAGYKLERLLRVQGDIARDLQCQSLRILSSVKDSGNIGIEIENSSRFSINYKNLLTGLPKDMKIPIALGEDAFGEPVYTDLTTLPHLLIAGTTGSGKSVFLNSIILTLLATQKPSELKLVMIDPKIVEFLDYKNVPHLLKPIASDPDDSIELLNFVVDTMEERFALLSEVNGAKNILDYNAATGERLPYIVFIIDEYADLMTGSSRAERNEIEQGMKRIAQKARAVGIHMIAATQKPNREVVTPLLKANLPARIAFSVTSGMDSRVILDCMGAERLAGNGDMLFKDPTAHNEHRALRRIQSPMVSRTDVATILNG